jgi:hypothetical protein
MKTKPTYEEIATNFKLWMEYADPTGYDTEWSFNQSSVEDKINFLIGCFGPETEADVIGGAQ